MDTFLRLIESAALLPLTWFSFLLAPFADFTFTDPGDFVFAALIVLTLALVIFRHTLTPHPAQWIKTASALSFFLSVLTPLVPSIMLYLLSWRAEIVLGHWPRMWMDDPKYICDGDMLYDKLRNAVGYASAFAGWGLFTEAALLLHLRQHLSKQQWWRQIGVFMAAWLAFSWDPGARYWWWLD